MTARAMLEFDERPSTAAVTRRAALRARSAPARASGGPALRPRVRGH